jgi:hypothetical protein
MKKDYSLIPLIIPIINEIHNLIVLFSLKMKKVKDFYGQKI